MGSPKKGQQKKTRVGIFEKRREMTIFENLEIKLVPSSAFQTYIFLHLQKKAKKKKNRVGIFEKRREMTIFGNLEIKLVPSSAFQTYIFLSLQKKANKKKTESAFLKNAAK